jgi:hypothetical protein
MPQSTRCVVLLITAKPALGTTHRATLWCCFLPDPLRHSCRQHQPMLLFSGTLNSGFTSCPHRDNLLFVCVISKVWYPALDLANMLHPRCLRLVGSLGRIWSASLSLSTAQYTHPCHLGVYRCRHVLGNDTNDGKIPASL